MAFPALLDACVLYPVGVRDLLLAVAERQVYNPYWTEAILDEMARNIVTDGRATAERIAAMREQMNLAFPAARIEGYESLIPAMTNHPKDRHVLAAAVRGSVGLIVTETCETFPRPLASPTTSIFKPPTISSPMPWIRTRRRFLAPSETWL